VSNVFRVQFSLLMTCLFYETLISGYGCHPVAANVFAELIIARMQLCQHNLIAHLIFAYPKFTDIVSLFLLFSKH